MYVSGEVILYKDRVVVSLSLRPRILNKLHSAHQDVTLMHAGAQQILFWPGITQDIEPISVIGNRKGIEDQYKKRKKIDVLFT